MLAHPGQVDVRITAKAGSVKEADILIGPVEKEVRSLLGKHIFASDDQTMETVVGELLRKANITICSYEDVTQGMLCDRLQRASLDHFAEGIVLSLIHISEPTRPRLLSYAVICLKK